MKRGRPDLPVLAIGGLDPSGHAGVLADARVFDSLGFSCRVAVTALTAQSEEKFYAWKPVDLALFRKQLRAAGQSFAGVKIGMLGTETHAREILRWLKKIRPPCVVWDPVWRSSTGARLFRGKAKILLPLLTVTDAWTPNLPEAEIFLQRTIRWREEAREAALDLWKLGGKKPHLVVLKGGHLEEKGPQAIDWFVQAGQVRELKAKRQLFSPRGTGCAFASALLAGLLFGKASLEAARFAKTYVWRKLFLTPLPTASTRKSRSGIASPR